jgi:probable blue pigment (indigoidine) exporter
MMLVVIFFAERFSFRLLLAAVMASTGITFLVSAQQGVLSTTGLIAGFGAAMSMAIGIVLSKKWPKPADLSLAAFTGWQLVAGGLVLLPLTLWQEGWPTTVSTQNVIGYLYLCLMGAVLAYLLWFRALQQLPAVTVSFLAFASPLSAVVMGYFCLAQTLTWLQFCGALAIFAAILFATKNSVATANADT